MLLTPGQAHVLTCAEPLIGNAEPKALLGDKAYDTDALIEALGQREITPVIPPKAKPQDQCTAIMRFTAIRNLIERFFKKNSSTLALSQHATTNSTDSFWPEFNSLAL